MKSTHSFQPSENLAEKLYLAAFEPARSIKGFSAKSCFKQLPPNEALLVESRDGVHHFYPLHAAVKLKLFPVVSWLIEHGADVNQCMKSTMVQKTIEVDPHSVRTISNVSNERVVRASVLDLAEGHMRDFLREQYSAKTSAELEYQREQAQPQEQSMPHWVFHFTV